MDINDDKVIDDKDRVIVGSPDPKFYGGFSTDFSYKGVTLNAVFNYSCGGKKLSPYYESLITSRGTGIASIDLLDRWTPENTVLNFHVLFIMILQIPKRCITILFLPVKWIFLYRMLRFYAYLL